MIIKFKSKEYQNNAVKSIVDCFIGQVKSSGVKYTIDPGITKPKVVSGQTSIADFDEVDLPDGVKNSEFTLSYDEILTNIQEVQQNQDLPVSNKLVKTSVSPINLEVEMETGTGKTYVYIKTMFELNEKYGWNKFIIVVPTIAIREGVYQSFELTKDHFQEQYKKQIRAFIYDSKRANEIKQYSEDPNINCMIINVQAFNAKGEDARRIHRKLEDFEYRRPIDLIKANRPILIIDEPQKINSDPKSLTDLKKESKSFQSLVEFNPLFVVSYSATHKVVHNKVHRLDAFDAYNQKLVKKIQVRGISIKGLSGTNGYIYLQDIVISKNKPPMAKIEIEIKRQSSIERKTLNFFETDNLFDKSNELEQYKGLKITNINPHTNTVEFSNGEKLVCGEATGNVDESTLRRLQIKETIKAHLDKEKELHNKGIKVLSLFFIDEVAKYRVYDNDIDSNGEYAKYFEEAYLEAISEIEDITNPKYQEYLNSINVKDTHNGYFSQDKNKRFVNSTVKTTGEEKGQSDDVSAYDLILKDKKLLLDLDPNKSPVRFIFSHSALREGWDNPNVFVICALKNVDGSNETSRRQEIGRGLRISVDKNGNRMDNIETVHKDNILTVVAGESFTDYVKALQKDIKETLSARPVKADEKYFIGKHIETLNGKIKIDEKQARAIYKYLLKNDYIDDNDKITVECKQDIKNGTLKEFPQELEIYKNQIVQLISSVYDENAINDMISDGRETKTNYRNSNFDKKEFHELWEQINKKAIYSVHYDSSELIKKCIEKLDSELNVKSLTYTIETGELDEMNIDKLESGENFSKKNLSTIKDSGNISTYVKYDLIGKIVENTGLTRKTVGDILKGVREDTFNKFKKNPEDFISVASRLITEQKATTLIEHISYDTINETYDLEDIFTVNQDNTNFTKAFKVNNHIYDYVEYDSKTEKDFAEILDVADNVVVYAKLPRGKYSIPTPLKENYTPDWAIAFKKGSVKHIYFIAETKGSMSSMQLREVERIKIECAKKYFKEISNKNVIYDKIDSFDELLKLIN
ncbi:DEAD/DEAH box helicase family protein [Aliarcobacter butzleri]|uniref:DEAD/DEAH box helicase family protein n=1 Tax=Aliarcobacter butzleri TaxID=28197 RepID=A0AAW7Q6Q3_9BACT|nr:DEAD/DEAH box helicase family protein [Aliarcobacter butzleri]MDN5114815.1 DEAD/DEAH box helicase family protein [Aliarcobacter butzleri]